MKLLHLFALCLPLLTFALPLQADELRDRYQAAVLDASRAEADELTNSLLSITSEQPVRDAQGRIRVVTWKAQGAYEKFLKPYSATSDNPDYGVWVTLSPQLENFCSRWLKQNPGADKAALDLRLKQYLGLDPSWNYDLVVELWVKPEALFRPCVDPETADSGCKLHFDKETPKVANIADYRDFYESLYYKSFRGSAGVPWTGLGYTFDWGNQQSDIGASEFILAPLSDYAIERAVPTLSYCGGA